jgi:hypothetical protein
MSRVFKSFELNAPGVTPEDKSNFMRVVSFFLEFQRLYSRQYVLSNVQ